MKNRKWLTYTVGILLTLVVLAAVGGAGFRIGMMQNASFARPFFMRGFNSAPQPMQRNFHDNGWTQGMRGNFHDNGQTQAMPGNPHNQGFGNRGSDRRGGGMSFFFPVFWLIRFAVLGLILWVGYKLVEKSGWRLTREVAPVTSKTPNAEAEEKKVSD